MSRRLIVTMILVASLPHVASAQWNLARRTIGDTRLSMSVGVDPAVIGSVGLHHTVRIVGLRTQLGADAGIVGGEADLRDYRARLGAEVQLVELGQVRVAAALSGIVRGTSTLLFRGTNIGADAGLTAGLYRRGWFVAGEAGFDKAILTHLVHSDWYRERVYREAKDGWYLDNGGTWRFGAAIGVSVGATELLLRGGLQRTQGWEPLLVPAYLSIGVGFDL
ncbi:MAG TPA: hypothetical protein VFN90_08865 [Gemmatimonadales bacterium]|nr:hypothetical protein [Gemmatimonadales bacterium]